MKVNDVLRENSSLMNDALAAKLVAQLLKRKGIESTIGKSKFWDIRAVSFLVDDGYTMEALFDETDEQPWILLRFDAGNKRRRMQFDTMQELVDYALHGDWKDA